MCILKTFEFAILAVTKKHLLNTCMHRILMLLLRVLRNHWWHSHLLDTAVLDSLQDACYSVREVALHWSSISIGLLMGNPTPFTSQLFAIFYLECHYHYEWDTCGKLLMRLSGSGFALEKSKERHSAMSYVGIHLFHYT